MGKGQKRLSFIILAIVLVVVLFVSLIGFIADFLWFKEMGYLSVFFKKLVTQLTVGVPTFIVVTGLVYLYLSKLKKGYFSKIASSEETDMRKLRKTTIALSAVFGIFATVMTIMQLWFEILKFANGTSFDISDPLFNMDISFYIFKLDFLTQLNEILIGSKTKIGNLIVGWNEDSQTIAVVPTVPDLSGCSDPSFYRRPEILKAYRSKYPSDAFVIYPDKKGYIGINAYDWLDDESLYVYVSQEDELAAFTDFFMKRFATK